MSAVPFGSQSGRPGPTFVVEGEELHLRAELAMVALLRLLEHREVGLQLGLVLERGAVDALELRVLFVAFVVGAGDVRELERADVAGAHHVRAGAEIDEIAVAIERNRFALGNVLDDIELEPRGLGSFRERREPAFSGELQRLLARDFDALEEVVRLDLLLHLLLDVREVLRRDAVRQVDDRNKSRSRPADRRRIAPPARCAGWPWPARARRNDEGFQFQS